MVPECPLFYTWADIAIINATVTRYVPSCVLRVLACLCTCISPLSLSSLTDWLTRSHWSSTCSAAKLRAIGDQGNDAVCPYSPTEMALNCTLAVECDTSTGQYAGEPRRTLSLAPVESRLYNKQTVSLHGAGRHGRDCADCTTQCRAMMVDNMRGAVDVVNYFFYVIILVLCVALLCESIQPSAVLPPA